LLTCLTVTHTLRVFPSFHDMHEITGLVQAVVKYDWVNDLATTEATNTCDADLTPVVLQVKTVLLAWRISVR